MQIWALLTMVTASGILGMTVADVENHKGRPFSLVMFLFALNILVYMAVHTFPHD